MINLRELAPWIALGFQAYLFVSIDSIEMKIALVIVVLFQLWKKSKQ